MDISVFTLLSILSPLLPLYAGFRERFSILWNYVLISLLSDLIISIVLKRALHTNTGLASNLFVVLEFLFITIYYHRQVFRKNLFYFVAAIPLLIFLVNTYLRSFMEFNFFGASILLFTYILYGLAGFFYLLRTQKQPLLEKSRFFWVNVAFIVYPSGSFLIMLFKDYLKATDEHLMKNLWIYLFPVLNISKNVLLAVAFTKEREEA